MYQTNEPVIYISALFRISNFDATSRGIIVAVDYIVNPLFDETNCGLVMISAMPGLSCRGIYSAPSSWGPSAKAPYGGQENGETHIHL